MLSVSRIHEEYQGTTRLHEGHGMGQFVYLFVRFFFFFKFFFPLKKLNLKNRILESKWRAPNFSHRIWRTPHCMVNSWVHVGMSLGGGTWTEHVLMKTILENYSMYPSMHARKRKFLNEHIFRNVILFGTNLNLRQKIKSQICPFSIK